MPTPFYHLSIAQQILDHALLSAAGRQILQANRGAFFLGNVAPDVQVVSGQPRAHTHFFDLPLRDNERLPWEALWSAFPHLRQSSHLPLEQRAFLAGYLCHLQADWLWISQIFIPVFGLRSPWGTFEERLKLHNVLRAYLDQQVLNSLPANLAAILQSTTPTRWLPFVADHHLSQWRDQLTAQLTPGNKVATVEVFAARQGVSAEEYYHLLSSEQAMDELIFSHINRHQLAQFRPQLIRENISLLRAYLEA